MLQPLFVVWLSILLGRLYYSNSPPLTYRKIYTGAFRHITGPAKFHTSMNLYKLKLQPNSWISISENMTWNTGFLVINGTGSANYDK